MFSCRMILCTGSTLTNYCTMIEMRVLCPAGGSEDEVLRSVQGTIVFDKLIVLHYVYPVAELFYQ